MLSELRHCLVRYGSAVVGIKYYDFCWFFASSPCCIPLPKSCYLFWGQPDDFNAQELDPVLRSVFFTTSLHSGDPLVS
jgi:hypothetical protein